MREFNFALKQTVPIFFTYLFIGVAFGALMSEAGYGILLTVASAVLIYAGSMQLLMVPMLAGGAPLWSLAVTALFINARHIFYGVGFIERFRKMGWRAPYMVLSLTDETYSLLSTVRYEDGMDASRAAFWIAALDHIYWIFGCFLGALAGRFLPFDLRGLEFSATAFFFGGRRGSMADASFKDPVYHGACRRGVLFAALRQRKLFDPDASFVRRRAAAFAQPRREKGGRAG